MLLRTAVSPTGSYYLRAGICVGEGGPRTSGEISRAEGRVEGGGGTRGSPHLKKQKTGWFNFFLQKRQEIYRKMKI